MSTTVCLAVLLGAAMPAASSPTFEDSPQTGEQRARIVAPDFEQLASAPRRDIPRWIDRLPGVEFPAGLRNNSGTHETAFLVRGQSPPYDPSSPGATGNPNLAQSMTLPPVDGTGSWIPNQGIWGGTPMLNPNGMFGGGQPQAMMAGVNGPRPYRFGWQSSFDVAVLPSARTNNAPVQRDFETMAMAEPLDPVAGLGRMGIFEFNSEFRYTTPAPMQHIFSIAPQFNMRTWDGPGTGPRTIDPVAADDPMDPMSPGTGDENPTGAPLNGFSPLAGSVYRFGLDLRLVSPSYGPYTVELDFNPSIGTDFERGISSHAWSFDGRGALFFRASPQYLVVLGAMFWDRVDDRVLPYAGVVFTPNQYVEIRALFPKAEASMFLGAPWGVPQWIYIAGEYHIEAYQVAVTTLDAPAVRENRIQIEDWRLMLGVRSEQNMMTSFLEAGWVFGRDVEFLRKATPGFDVSSGFIARFGVRY